ncbi:MAG: DUF2130 domain-containing protein [Candidatus Gracilibacteria bacterium]|nr:DUF2130 domain-containing protein [Candidatus Gracilibacteria bacterium]
MSQTIICPNCSTQIDLDKLADQKYSEKLREQETKLRDEQERQRLKFEKEMEDKTNEMRKKAQEYAEKKADEERKKVELEMRDMKERLEKSEKEQMEAKKKELEFMRKQRELEDKEKNFELEMEKKMFEERKKIEASVEEKLKENSKKEMDEKMEKIQEENRKKEMEMMKQQEQMKKTIDELKRKAEQGSQQIQGDIQEDDLKNAISQAFPIDSIEDVPTGVKGADLIQKVKNNIGQDAGVIIWESKNTKSWTDGWIPKLKDDKLKINAQIAILVTTVLPKDMKEFGFVDDVMVCLPKYAVGVATMLRDKLISISKVEKSMEGKDIKMEMLYKYLRSEEFGSKVVTIVEVFSKLKADIDIERRAMEKIWKRREKELERASLSTTMMYGELEGLMGQALPGAEMLELGAGDDDLDDL